jgi:hypothetical protein
MNAIVPCSGRFGLLIFVAAVALIAGGCQNSLAPVSGRVTLNGKPLAGAVVTFQPQARHAAPVPAATGSTGRTDKEGRFTLHSIEPNRAGALIGEHIVTISASSGGSDAAPPTGPILPKDWRDGTKHFKVQAGGTTAANFDIKS